MTKTIEIRIPKGWAELGSSLFMRYLKNLYRGEVWAKIQIWKSFDRKTFRAVQRLGDAELEATIHSEVIEAFSWMETAPDFSLILKFGRHRWINIPFLDTLYFSDAQMSNSTIGEFILADTAYKKIVKGYEDGDLEIVQEQTRILLAILARPRKLFSKSHYERTGDHRIPILSQAHAETLAEKISPRIAKLYGPQAIIYFTGIKNFISEKYGPFLFDGEPVPGRLNLEWHGNVLTVAETGIFGDFESTYQSNLHAFLLYLIKRKMDAEASIPTNSES